jgi:CRISPR-associated endoribonuclease Cas6
VRVRVMLSNAVPRRVAHIGARPVAYRILAAGDPALARQVHEIGWQGTARRPWSILPPVHPRQFLEIATPDDTLAQLFIAGATAVDTVNWAGQTLTVQAVSVIDDRRLTATRRWQTATPVVVRGDPPERRVLVPGDDGWARCLRASITAASAFLQVAEPSIRSITAGRRVVLDVADGRKMAAAASVSVEVAGDPNALSAVEELGLGSRGPEGFGYLAGPL